MKSVWTGPGWWTVPPALSPCPNLDKVLQPSCGISHSLQRLPCLSLALACLQRQSIFLSRRGPDLAGESVADQTVRTAPQRQKLSVGRLPFFQRLTQLEGVL